MKKALAIGLIILFTGIILTTSFATIQQRRTQKLEIERVNDSWTISGFFEKDVNLTLEFRQHSDWSLRFYLEPDDVLLYRKHLWINITDTATGNYTLFKVVLMPPLQYTPPSPPYLFNLYVASIEITHHGALIVEDSPNVIGGIAKNSGEYVAECWLEPEWVDDRDLQGNPWPHPASPPRDLYLYAVSVETTYPYGFLLPLGLSTVAIGMVATVWGVKGQKRKARHKIIRK